MITLHKNNGIIIRIIQVSIAILLLCSCAKTPTTIPTGEWSFALFVNKTRVGTATIANRCEGGKYISIVEMTMKAGGVTNVAKQIITETIDFKPLKYETYNKIIKDNYVQHITTVADISGKKVTLITDSSQQEIQIEKDFKLEGNYFLAQFIAGGFRNGMKVEAYIYEPAIDPEAPVLLKAMVAGRESITIGERKYNAIRVIEYIEKFKSFDMYLDESGILLKADITMLNMQIELVRE
ncbi:MAG: hypothetical protein N2316_02780 [Spirochaetes bacterium]|nr:hypothetical protein [Spirochaetota bacterium]